MPQGARFSAVSAVLGCRTLTQRGPACAPVVLSVLKTKAPDALARDLLAGRGVETEDKLQAVGPMPNGVRAGARRLIRSPRRRGRAASRER
jgi:hypothetical protein